MAINVYKRWVFCWNKIYFNNFIIIINIYINLILKLLIYIFNSTKKRINIYYNVHKQLFYYCNKNKNIAKPIHFDQIYTMFNKTMLDFKTKWKVSLFKMAQSSLASTHKSFDAKIETLTVPQSPLNVCAGVLVVIALEVFALPSFLEVVIHVDWHSPQLNETC